MYSSADIPRTAYRMHFRPSPFHVVRAKPDWGGLVTYIGHDTPGADHCCIEARFYPVFVTWWESSDVFLWNEAMKYSSSPVLKYQQPKCIHMIQQEFGTSARKLSAYNKLPWIRYAFSGRQDSSIKLPVIRPALSWRRWLGMPEGLQELRSSTGYSPESSSVTVSMERYSVECPWILSRRSLFISQRVSLICGARIALPFSQDISLNVMPMSG